MDKLETINVKLRELNSELIELADSIDFEPICEFNLEHCATTIPWNNIVYSGVYLIEIKNDLKFNDFTSWVENFREEWEDPRYKLRFVSNLRKIRISQHSELKEWIPIYIGKSKQIGGRIHQHIYKELGKPTFALKLNERENMKKYTFRLSTIKVSPDNYDWVMPVFEKTLRNRIHPIIGRQ
nr:hypothetical protein [uncultured Flavobacterium sp.]